MKRKKYLAFLLCSLFSFTENLDAVDKSPPIDIWVQKGPASEAFKYTVNLPDGSTHEIKLQDENDHLIVSLYDQYKNGDEISFTIKDLYHDDKDAQTTTCRGKLSPLNSKGQSLQSVKLVLKNINGPKTKHKPFFHCTLQSRFL